MFVGEINGSLPMRVGNEWRPDDRQLACVPPLDCASESTTKLCAILPVDKAWARQKTYNITGMHATISKMYLPEDQEFAGAVASGEQGPELSSTFYK